MIVRNSFIKALLDEAEKEERIWLLTGDIGFGVLDSFAERFPGRFVNVGVAEQNMTGIAAGLAITGRIVFTYSIANFPVMRCLEQIRNDVCYHRLNVKICAVGGGLSYGSLGYSHHGYEDLAVMRALPNMTIVAPGDPLETALAVRALVRFPGPAYLRLGKANEPIVHPQMPEFQLGQAIRMQVGSDLTLAATGSGLAIAVKAAQILSRRGTSVDLLSIHTLSPLDALSLEASIRQTRKIITIEDHGVGGLGSAVAELVATSNIQAKLAMVRLRGEPVKRAGSQERLQDQCGLSVENILTQAESLLQEKL